MSRAAHVRPAKPKSLSFCFVAFVPSWLRSGTRPQRTRPEGTRPEADAKKAHAVVGTRKERARQPIGSAPAWKFARHRVISTSWR